VIVCVCHRVSDRDIEHEVRNGCHDFEALQDELHVGTSCGACVQCARETYEVARACHLDARVATPAGVAVTPVAAPVHVITLGEISRVAA
jgi:bacterioferritin-associated ferredoxin